MQCWGFVLSGLQRPLQLLTFQHSPPPCKKIKRPSLFSILLSCREIKIFMLETSKVSFLVGRLKFPPLSMYMTARDPSHFDHIQILNFWDLRKGFSNCFNIQNISACPYTAHHHLKFLCVREQPCWKKQR